MDFDFTNDVEDKYSDQFEKFLNDTINQDEVIYEDDSLTQNRLKAQTGPLRDLIAFWRQYPDIFIDMVKGKDCKFTFLHYQRQFLRAVMRHRYVYATFPRA